MIHVMAHGALFVQADSQEKRLRHSVIGTLCLLKTPKGQESLEIFAPPPYRPGHDHNSFRPRFYALVPCSPPRLTGV
jgi:hypothetical protein